MAFIVPYRAQTIHERGRVYKMGRPVEITDEALYHHLIRTGRFRDPQKDFKPIPADHLPRVRPGALITVCREVGLGDVLMVLVVMKALKDRRPNLRYRLATGRAYLPLLEGIDWLDGVESLMDMRGRVDNVIDLRNVPERHDQREKMDRIDIFAATCGVSVADYSIPIAPVTDEERRRARELIGPGRTIAIAVRGSTHVRTWPIASVRAFAELAADRGWTVAVLDAEAVDMPAHPSIKNLAGKIGLVESKAVIAASEFCISPDSGLTHLAEAVGTRCLAIYSTTPPALRISHYRSVKAIWRESLPCVPCFDRGCPAAPCMHIAPEIVMRAVEDWDSLGKWTSVDAIGYRPVTAIPVVRESEIMESWPMAAMG